MCLTQSSEPAGNSSIDFIQDDDDDEVDDGSSGFDCGSDIIPNYRVAAHVQRCPNANPVQDDSKDYNKRHNYLKYKRGRINKCVG